AAAGRRWCWAGSGRVRAAPGTGPWPARRRDGCARRPDRRGGTPAAHAGGNGRTRRPCRSPGGIPAGLSSFEPEEFTHVPGVLFLAALAAQVKAQLVDDLDAEVAQPLVPAVGADR